MDISTLAPQRSARGALRLHIMPYLPPLTFTLTDVQRKTPPAPRHAQRLDFRCMRSRISSH
eukprot:2602264-Prymnesium_polylepis.1